MMVQATIVEIEKVVMEEEEVRGTGGLHMVKEEDIVEKMMMNLKMRLMTTASNSVLVADVIEENHEERFGKLKFTMPKFASEPSMRNFSR